MKNVRFFCTVLIFMLSLSIFSACANLEDITETSNNGTNTQLATNPDSSETVDTSDPNINKKYITSKDAFVDKMEELLDLSLYDELDEYGSSDFNGYSYCLKVENEKDYDLDYTIMLGDGSSFTMPITFSELSEKGWVLFRDTDRELGAGFMTQSSIRNAVGKVISVAAYNPTEEAFTFQEGTVIALEAQQYSIDDFTKKLSDAVDFTVCDSLTNNSTLEDIIKRLGNPTSITCSLYFNDEQYRCSDIEVEYIQESSAYSSIVFNLSGDGNYITNLRYEIAPE